MVCLSDTGLSRPTPGFARATTTKSSDPREPESEICNVAVFPETVLAMTVAPEGIVVLVGVVDCRTLTAVTPAAKLYVMVAVLPEYVMLPSVGLANLATS